MAGPTVTRIQQIVNDFKTSWYFRFWALGWLGFAILAFSCLIILARHSNHMKERPEVNVWYQNASTMRFPDFQFRVDDRMMIDSVSCSMFSTVVPSGTPCPPWRGVQLDTDHCQLVTGSMVEIMNQGDYESFEPSISCNITTTGNSTETGNMIAFDVVDPNSFTIGGNSYGSIWMAPYHNWVILEKGVVPNGKKSVIDAWSRQLQYHSTVYTPGNYSTRIVFQGFGVLHFEVTDVYNGWKAIGDIGGFAFFLVCMHTILMILLGFVFTNESSFLKDDATSSSAPSGSQATYQQL